VQCDFDNDGETITLELADAAYDVVVYTATTGEVVGTVSLEASSTDCPMFLFIDEGQTQYVNTLSADDIINALKPYVTPA
jgi:maleate cis-trans isomerase